MGKVSSLIRYLGTGFLRERSLVLTLVVLPILLLVTGRISAPADMVAFTMDSTLIISNSETMLLSLYALTAVVLVASVSSFSFSFNFKPVVPRLTLLGYQTVEISFAFLLLVGGINLFAVGVTWLYVTSVMDVQDPFGLFVGLVFASIIFSTIGLILSDLTTSKTLGLYLVLTLAMMDTAFIENPVFSRRYNDKWVDLMPSHHSLTIILRSVYETGTDWSSILPQVLLYELILVLFLILTRKFKATIL